MRDLPDIEARCHLESASADSKLVLVHKRGYILRFRLHQERVIFLNLAKQNMTAYNAKHPYEPDWQIPKTLVDIYTGENRGKYRGEFDSDIVYLSGFSSSLLEDLNSWREDLQIIIEAMVDHAAGSQSDATSFEV